MVASCKSFGGTKAYTNKSILKSIPQSATWQWNVKLKLKIDL